MTEKLYRERLKFFLLGLVVAMGIFSLMGFKANDDVVIDNGRYQIAAWGSEKAHGAFVMDSITGQTKIVYRYKEVGNDRFKERNNLKTPFANID